MKFKLGYFIPFLLFTSVLFGQNTDSTKLIKKMHFITIKTQFAQYKDQFNYGLVFSGINLDLGYASVRTVGNKTTSYNGGFAIGINSNKGAGLALRIKPVDYFYGVKLESRPLTIGMYVLTNYIWQFYPEIQSGHMFWFSAWEMGPKVIFKIPVKSKTLTCAFSNSLFGLTSRPKPETETTFYSLNLIDYVKFSHHNIKFGSYNNFNHTHLQIGLLNNNKKPLSIWYSFEYYGYYKNPKISLIFHSLDFNFKIGKLHEN